VGDVAVLLDLTPELLGMDEGEHVQQWILLRESETPDT
jgi:hypothetical protein